MQIISHRGAKGVAAENTIESIAIAATKNISYIEFDIQHTKNGKIIVHHDTELPSGKVITTSTFKAIQREVPTIIELDEALVACGNIPALIESKTKGTIARSLPILKKYPSAAIASFQADEILSARINAPLHETYLLQHIHPFGIIAKAKKIDAHGIGLNKNWAILFPFYYYAAKKAGLKTYTYTVNNTWIAEWLHTFFPQLLICTDFPDAMLALSKDTAHAK
jgi:glycerophosphoryl diester phosphodiesterase